VKVAAIEDCCLIELPKVSDPRGNLTFMEENRHVPFEVRRVFYIYDIPTEASRGAHAHRMQHQFLVCLSGSFDVEFNDGVSHGRVHLNRPWRGLHIPPMIWAAETNFGSGSVCLVLASGYFDERDYIRNFDDYLSLTKRARRGGLPA
jgi:dTDP-4-dehydrorhamnose 3,5-epimerase-like enzyme